MVDDRILDVRVAILATDGFEESELAEPKKALEAVGATVHVVAPQGRSIRGFRHFEKGESFDVDVELAESDPSTYDALVLPGGLFNPDALRVQEKALLFVASFFREGKPVGAICHGPQIMINANVVKGRKMTSVPSIARDLANAGAEWKDEEVVTDEGLVTSRTPDDLPAFCAKLVEEIREGCHENQHRRFA